MQIMIMKMKKKMITSMQGIMKFASLKISLFLAENVENFVENFKKHSKIKGLRCGKICGKHVENSEIYLF